MQGVAASFPEVTCYALLFLLLGRRGEQRPALFAVRLRFEQLSKVLNVQAADKFVHDLRLATIAARWRQRCPQR
jgi:hypothetical protein